MGVSACAYEQLSATVADQCPSTECALPLLASYLTSLNQIPALTLPLQAIY